MDATQGLDIDCKTPGATQTSTSGNGKIASASWAEIKWRSNDDHIFNARRPAWKYFSQSDASNEQTRRS